MALSRGLNNLGALTTTIFIWFCPLNPDHFATMNATPAPRSTSPHAPHSINGGAIRASSIPAPKAGMAITAISHRSTHPNGHRFIPSFLPSFPHTVGGLLHVYAGYG